METQQARREPRAVASYLVVHIDRQGREALVAMEAVREVLTLEPGRLTVMPHLSTWVLGLVNYRTRVLWLVDLAARLGLPPLEEAPSCSYSTVVVRDTDHHFCLAVHQILGVTRCLEPVAPGAGAAEPWQAGTLGGLLVLDVAGLSRSLLERPERSGR